MSIRMYDNKLICTSPALTYDFDEYTEFIYQGTLDHDYHLSLEMIEFLPKYSIGQYNDSTRHQRCHAIATRKGCYKNPIINGFGIITEEGQKALLNAKIIEGKLKRYYERARGTWLTSDNAKDMDEIIPFGQLPGYSLRMLAYLWDINDYPDNEQLRTTAHIPHSWRIGKVTIEDQHFMLMSSIRTNMYARAAADIILKFGLIDLVNLPKSPQSQGRGRAPVGITLNEMGRRFYESYLNTFDPKQKFNQHLKASYRAAHPEEFGDLVVSRPSAMPSSGPTPSTPTTSSGYYSLRNQVESVEYEVYTPPVDYNPTAEPEQDQPEYSAEPQDQQEPAQLSQKGPVSDLPDIVDGENLRDLFG